MNGWVGKVHTATNWFTKLVYLNVLWFLFTMGGLVIFGFMPATVALFTIVRKWIMGDTSFSIFKTFLVHFKKDFLKVNGLGLVFLLIAGILLLDILLIQNSNSMIMNFFLLIVFSFSIVFTIIVLYFFPIFVHYDVRIIEIMKNALLIGLAKPLTTMLMMASLFFGFILFFTFPGIILFFSVSPLALLIMYWSFKAFNKLEEQKGTSQKELGS